MSCLCGATDCPDCGQAQGYLGPWSEVDAWDEFDRQCEAEKKALAWRVTEVKKIIVNAPELEVWEVIKMIAPYDLIAMPGDEPGTVVLTQG